MQHQFSFHTIFLLKPLYYSLNLSAVVICVYLSCCCINKLLLLLLLFSTYGQARTNREMERCADNRQITAISINALCPTLWGRGIIKHILEHDVLIQTTPHGETELNQLHHLFPIRSHSLTQRYQIWSWDGILGVGSVRISFGSHGFQLRTAERELTATYLCDGYYNDSTALFP